MTKDLLLDISRYFRDFLDTDFKHQRLPKRHIQRQDSMGNLTSIALSKYPALAREIWQKLAMPLADNFELTINRGSFQAKITNEINALIVMHARGMNEEDALNLIESIQRTARDKAGQLSANPDQLKAEVLTVVHNDVVKVIVAPLLARLENHFDVLSMHGVETPVDIEEDVCNRLVGNYAEAIGQALAIALSEQDFSVFDTLIVSLLSIEPVREKLLENFASFAIDDFFNELNELLNTVKTQENTEVYLYIGDIHYGQTRYPLFYLPLQLSQVGQVYTIAVDSRLYINKKALDFVGKEIKREQKNAPEPSVCDRMMSLDRSQNVVECIQRLLNEWATQLMLSPAIDLSNMDEQKACAISVTMTNRLHFAASDKADESLLKDYEDLLNLADQDSAAFGGFADIVHGFLYDDPVPVTSDVERAWEELPIEQRLVYRSPIPLNEEQRRILSALNRDECRFVTVQGPPGTGKSHTIAAITFEAIMAQQNVLILADKTEALSVVEDKLNQTFNQVRGSRDIQNPILRLGCSATVYSKVLSTQAMEQLMVYHRDALINVSTLQRQLNQQETDLKENLKQLITAYESIDIAAIMKFHRMDVAAAQGKVKFLALVDQEQSMSTLRAVSAVATILQDESNSIVELLSLVATRPSLSDLENLLDIQPVLTELGQRFSGQCNAVQFFVNFDHLQLEVFAQFIQRYQVAQWPLFGFMLNRTKARQIDAAFGGVLSCRNSLDIHRHLDTLTCAYSIFSVLKQLLEQQFHHASYFKLAFQQLAGNITIAPNLVQRLRQAIQQIHQDENSSTLLSTQLGLAAGNLLPWGEWIEDNQHQVDMALNYHRMYHALQQSFQALPQVDYMTGKTRLEDYHAQALTNLIDARVIAFHENCRAESQSVREIIVNKQRFPLSKFKGLQLAFPCIIANIRDYAEYVPLQRQLFDIVIIDEASQVSIAQAFPAMMRAKKIVVLGDHKQFSNAKTSGVSTEINDHYINKMLKRFINAHDPDSDVIGRLKKFNIKTSVLEFVDMLANHGTMLKKHFRGYPELIYFSSHYFYYDQLQAIKIRTKPIEDVIQLTVLDQRQNNSVCGNVNEAEVTYILGQLNQLIALDPPPSVGVITPFTDQQRYLSHVLFDTQKNPNFIDSLQLKVMTFDSCQGEERDIVFYSMVAHSTQNQLYAIFPKSLDTTNKIKHQLRMQRLNVGLSRAKEKIHFVLSQPVEQFTGAIGSVLQHYQQVLTTGRLEIEATGSSSQAEEKVWNWVKATAFYQHYINNITCFLRFPMADYLNQLDHDYRHPGYRVAVLLKLDVDNRSYHFIIEYDGFTEFLSDLDDINAKHYRHYYNGADVEREKVLENYGYRLLRINRFDSGTEPVLRLSELLTQNFKAMRALRETLEMRKSKKTVTQHSAKCVIC